MESRVPPFAFLFLFLLLSSTASAFNITKLLDRFPDFSNFNDMLTQTKLSSQINSRQTITILTVDNGGMGPLNGKSTDVQRRILGNHVILDYYDTEKLNKLAAKSTILTTLFQTTGLAERKQGFLNVTKKSDGIYFGSAVPGSPLVSKLIKPISALPYNITVQQVSSIIVADGMDVAPSPQELTPPPPPPPRRNRAPVEAPAEEPDEETVEAPEPSGEAPEAESPDSDSPGPAPAPEKSKPADQVQAPAPSSSTRVGLCSVIVLGLVSALMA